MDNTKRYLQRTATAKQIKPMSLFDTIRQTAKGALVLADWLGSGGKPVLAFQAESRALTCLVGNNGKPCPFNVQPLWWEKAKGSIAAAIRDHVAIKNELALKVTREDELHMCRKCGCCLRTKVWVPMEHVRKVLDRKTIEELPSYCWMRTELLTNN